MQMQLDTVVFGKRGCQPTLCPVAGGLRERRRGDKCDRSAGACGAQRGIQSGGARSDDYYIGLARDLAWDRQRRGGHRSEPYLARAALSAWSSEGGSVLPPRWAASG